jgi:RNA polymerase primary sigma factor
MRRQFGPRVPGEDSIYLRMLQEQLHAVLDTLSDREAGVISMRFGLVDGQQRHKTKSVKFMA